MLCPTCGAKATVIETRKIGEAMRRRRACSDLRCDHRFTTIELVVDERHTRKLAETLRWVGRLLGSPSE